MNTAVLLRSLRIYIAHLLRRITPFAATILLVSPIAAYASPRAGPLNEDAALALLVRTLKHDHVYEKRISLDCVTYSTEETKKAYFQFALLEKHDAKCGGDPETSPAVDRYRVYRRSGRIQWLESAEDKWQPYNPAQIK